MILRISLQKLCPRLEKLCNNTLKANLASSYFFYIIRFTHILSLNRIITIQGLLFLYPGLLLKRILKANKFLKDDQTIKIYWARRRRHYILQRQKLDFYRHYYGQFISYLKYYLKQSLL